MTRINAGIPVESLTDQHLVAEIKEINQLAGSFRKSIENKTPIERANLLSGLPETFRLGKGHVKFFYDKPKFLEERFDKVKEEGLRRGFEIVTVFQNEWAKLKFSWPNYNYSPTSDAIRLLKERISSRLAEQRLSPRYQKEDISRAEAIALILKSQS